MDAKEREAAARTRAAEFGIDPGEDFAADWIESEAEPFRHVSDEKPDPLTRAGYLALLKEAAIKHGLKPNFEAMLQQAIDAGLVVQTADEALVTGLRERMREEEEGR